MTNQQWFDRLENTMPYGSSTSSKSAQYLPEEPAVIARGKGCRVWDAEDREIMKLLGRGSACRIGWQKSLMAR